MNKILKTAQVKSKNEIIDLTGYEFVCNELVQKFCNKQQIEFDYKIKFKNI